jgi:DNA-binding winged helix-turn-helix (wHTH) protein
MQSTPHPMRSVRFGVFEVNFEAGELRKSGLKVALQEQPFHVLTLLLENAGKLVSRDELQQKIWSADTFVEIDRGLNTAINKVRDALGDSAGSPRFIETVPRRGYRFLAPVEPVNGNHVEKIASGSPASPVPQGRRFPVGLAALSVALAAAVGIIVWDWFHRTDPGRDLPVRKFDLVLPDLTPNTSPVISPDGQKIVYDVRTSAQPNGKLRVYRLDAGESYDVAGTEGSSSTLAVLLPWRTRAAVALWAALAPFLAGVVLFADLALAGLTRGFGAATLAFLGGSGFSAAVAWAGQW